MDRLNRALSRNINEVFRAVYNRRALNALADEGAAQSVNMTFFRLAYMALYDDMISHVIKVLEDRQQAASFWYIYRCQQAPVDRFANDRGFNLLKLREIEPKLKNIRDKTHFHIDRDAVRDPGLVWKNASITGNDFAEALEILSEILLYLWNLTQGSNYPLATYDADDVEPIVAAARSAGAFPALPE